jgi:hypothetical protein
MISEGLKRATVARGKHFFFEKSESLTGVIYITFFPGVIYISVFLFSFSFPAFSLPLSPWTTFHSFACSAFLFLRSVLRTKR